MDHRVVLRYYVHQTSSVRLCYTPCPTVHSLITWDQSPSDTHCVEPLRKISTFSLQCSLKRLYTPITLHKLLTCKSCLTPILFNLHSMHWTSTHERTQSRHDFLQQALPELANILTDLVKPENSKKPTRMAHSRNLSVLPVLIRSPRLIVAESLRIKLKYLDEYLMVLQLIDGDSPVCHA